MEEHISQQILSAIQSVSGQVKELDVKFDEKFDGLEKRIASLEADVAALARRTDERFGAIDARFEQMDARFTGIDVRFDQMDARFVGIDARFEETNAHCIGIDAHFEELSEAIQLLAEQIEEVSQRLTRIGSQMVTKSYLDEKLFALRGDLVAMIRRTDGKTGRLITVLAQKDVLKKLDMEYIQTEEQIG